MVLLKSSKCQHFGLFFYTGQLYGLEKFWAFLKYSRKHIDFDPKLKEWLTKFKRLEDFRVDVSCICSLTYYHLVSSADYFCKQFGPRSGPTECRA